MIPAMQEYRVTSPFGWRTSPISGKREFHTGIDLVKGHRAPICAFVDGEVIHAKAGVAGSGFGGYGIVVAIRDTATDHLHCYAHLDSTLVKVGDKVKRGQQIGLQGSTGQSTGSHLHYEIRKTSSPQYGWIANRENNCFDPVKYLDDYFSKAQGTPSYEEKPVINRKPVSIEILLPVQGYVVDGVSYLPIRAVVETVGAKLEWFPDTKQVQVNGLDITEYIENGISYAPSRELAEILGLTVEWIEEHKIVKLRMN